MNEQDVTLTFFCLSINQTNLNPEYILMDENHIY